MQVAFGTMGLRLIGTTGLRSYESGEVFSLRADKVDRWLQSGRIAGRPRHLYTARPLDG